MNSDDDDVGEFKFNRSNYDMDLLSLLKKDKEFEIIHKKLNDIALSLPEIIGFGKQINSTFGIYTLFKNVVDPNTFLYRAQTSLPRDITIKYTGTNNKDKYHKYELMMFKEK